MIYYYKNSIIKSVFYKNKKFLIHGDLKDYDEYIVDIKYADSGLTFNGAGLKDWGDGSSDTTDSHTYASSGTYTIKYYGIYTGSNIIVDNYSAFLKEVHLSINKLYDRSFIYNQNLEKITIPNSEIKKIPSLSFYDCRKLSNIILPDGLESIWSTAFGQCYSLVNIELPNTVNYIANEAFESCNSLANISFKGTTEQCRAILKINSSALIDTLCTVITCTDGYVNVEDLIVD